MKVSKVFFDARFIRHDNHDGISRFSLGVLTALAKKTAVVALICDEKQIQELPSGIEHYFLNDPKDFFKELFIARKINRLGAEIVFSPMQTMGSWFRKYKLILTLHDLIYFAHPSPPKSLSPLIRVVWRLFHLSYQPTRMILNRADAIATVSETTKKLMLEKSLTNKPISVIYNSAEEANSKHAVEAVANKSSRQKTLIYMGSFMDYKNVETLIAAMEFLPDFELKLLSTITNKRKEQLLALQVSGGGGVQFLNGVSEQKYKELLTQSTALITASKDEGFGIPLVEAMSLGVPVVVSDIEIFREVAGDAALFFEKNNPKELAESVLKLVDERTWLDYSARAIKRAENFSWDKSATELQAMIARL